MAASPGMAVVAAATLILRRQPRARVREPGDSQVLAVRVLAGHCPDRLHVARREDRVGGAARGSREFELGYGSERPVELPVPAPDVNADATQAIKEIESRGKLML